MDKYEFCRIFFWNLNFGELKSNPNFRVPQQIFQQKSKFWASIDILEKHPNLGQTSKFSLKNLNLGTHRNLTKYPNLQKSNFIKNQN